MEFQCGFCTFKLRRLHILLLDSSFVYFVIPSHFCYPFFSLVNCDLNLDINSQEVLICFCAFSPEFDNSACLKLSKSITHIWYTLSFELSMISLIPFVTVFTLGGQFVMTRRYQTSFHEGYCFLLISCFCWHPWVSVHYEILSYSVALTNSNCLHSRHLFLQF